jgi:hypothetical protein
MISSVSYADKEDATEFSAESRACKRIDSFEALDCMRLISAVLQRG